MAIRIPKRLSHIWIGPKPAPTEWMKTWPEKHPKWEYRVFDNDFLRSFPFRTRRLINEYFWRGEYAGVQDLMRYEILYEFGGFMADADAVCLHPVDKLLTRAGLYTVYDRATETGRGVCPFLASNPGNPLLGAVIERLCQLEPWQLRKPFHSTGNLFLMSMIREWGEDKLTIFPSHYFVPWHHTTPEDIYDGPDTVYAEQKWGTATFRYNRGTEEGEETLTRQTLAERAFELREDLIKVVQPEMTPESKHATSPDPQVLRAEANNPYQAVISSPDWRSNLKALNATLVSSLKQAGHPAVFNGHGFYRHQQELSIAESPLMTRTTAFRETITSYLAGARSVMQIGIDCGHMLLLQKMVTPYARITAVDTCTQLLPKSAPVEIYTPAAIEWFKALFPDQFHFLIGRPTRTIPDYLNRESELSFDLIHFNGIDANFLKSYGATIGALHPDGIILIQDPDGEKVKARVQQLQMLNEVATPLSQIDFGRLRGGVAVLRRKAA